MSHDIGRRMPSFVRPLISGWVAVCFLASQPPVYPSLSETPAENVPVPKNFPKALAKVQVPEEQAEVQEAFQGVGNRVVILVKDIHAVAEAQRNIQKVIDFFQREYGLDQIALEGASGTLDPQLFRSFPEESLLRQVLEEYAEKGELTGANAAAIFSPRQTPFYGIEDWVLYEEGIGLFLQAGEREQALLKELRVERQRIREAKKNIYSSELLDVDRLLESFEETPDLFLSILQRLAQVLAPQSGSELALLLQEFEGEGKDRDELEIEVKQIGEKIRAWIHEAPPSEKQKAALRAFNENYQAFQTSRLSAGAFARFLKEWADQENVSVAFSAKLLERVRSQSRLEVVEGTKVFQEFESYSRSVKESLFRGAEERKLDEESHRLHLMEKLARLELSREEWVELKQGGVNDRFKIHLEFYTIAEKREEAFDRNLWELLEGCPDGQPSSTCSTLVVTGGFHTSALAERLREKGIGYLVLMPQVTSLPDSTAYRAHMRGEISWKEYFRVEKGSVNLYEAFVRATRDKLLDVESRPYILKSWRDQIIRDLAEQGKLAEAHQYTRFLDELTREKSPLWVTQIHRFLDGLRRLESEGKLTQPNVLKLLKGSVTADPTASVLSPEARSRVIAAHLEGTDFVGDIRPSSPDPLTIRPEAREHKYEEAVEVFFEKFRQHVKTSASSYWRDDPDDEGRELFVDETIKGLVSRLARNHRMIRAKVSLEDLEEPSEVIEAIRLLGRSDGTVYGILTQLFVEAEVKAGDESEFWEKVSDRLQKPKELISFFKERGFSVELVLLSDGTVSIEESSELEELAVKGFAESLEQWMGEVILEEKEKIDNLLKTQLESQEKRRRYFLWLWANWALYGQFSEFTNNYWDDPKSVKAIEFDKALEEYEDKILSRPEARKPVILLVDDDAAVVGMHQMLFTMEGYTVLTASNGKEAIEAVKNQAVDLVLTDKDMPQKGGLEFIQEVREGEIEGVSQDLNIILISGELDEKARSMAENYNVPAFGKPVDFGLLLAVIENRVGKPKGKSEARTGKMSLDGHLNGWQGIPGRLVAVTPGDVQELLFYSSYGLAPAWAQYVEHMIENFERVTQVIAEWVNKTHKLDPAKKGQRAQELKQAVEQELRASNEFLGELPLGFLVEPIVESVLRGMPHTLNTFDLYFLDEEFRKGERKRRRPESRHYIVNLSILRDTDDSGIDLLPLHLQAVEDAKPAVEPIAQRLGRLSDQARKAPELRRDPEFRLAFIKLAIEITKKIRERFELAYRGALLEKAWPKQIGDQEALNVQIRVVANLAYPGSTEMFSRSLRSETRPVEDPYTFTYVHEGESTTFGKQFVEMLKAAKAAGFKNNLHPKTSEVAAVYKGENGRRIDRFENESSEVRVLPGDIFRIKFKNPRRPEARVSAQDLEHEINRVIDESLLRLPTIIPLWYPIDAIFRRSDDTEVVLDTFDGDIHRKNPQGVRILSRLRKLGRPDWDPIAWYEVALEADHGQRRGRLVIQKEPRADEPIIVELPESGTSGRSEARDLHPKEKEEVKAALSKLVETVSASEPTERDGHQTGSAWFYYKTEKGAVYRIFIPIFSSGEVPNLHIVTLADEEPVKEEDRGWRGVPRPLASLSEKGLDKPGLTEDEQKEFIQFYESLRKSLDPELAKLPTHPESRRSELALDKEYELSPGDSLAFEIDPGKPFVVFARTPRSMQRRETRKQEIVRDKKGKLRLVEPLSDIALAPQVKIEEPHYEVEVLTGTKIKVTNTSRDQYLVFISPRPEGRITQLSDLHVPQAIRDAKWFFEEHIVVEEVRTKWGVKEEIRPTSKRLVVPNEEMADQLREAYNLARRGARDLLKMASLRDVSVELRTGTLSKRAVDGDLELMADAYEVVLRAYEHYKAAGEKRSEARRSGEKELEKALRLIRSSRATDRKDGAEELTRWIRNWVQGRLRVAGKASSEPPKDFMDEAPFAVAGLLRDWDNALVFPLAFDALRWLEVGKWPAYGEAMQNASREIGLIVEALVSSEEVRRNSAKKALERVVELVGFRKPLSVELQKLGQSIEKSKQELSQKGESAEAKILLEILSGAEKDIDILKRWAQGDGSREKEFETTESVDILLVKLKHQDPKIRRQAAEQLGERALAANEVMPKIVTQIAELLNDPDPGVRETAALALGEVGARAREAIPGLTKLLDRREKNPESVRQAAAQAAGSIAKSDAELEIPEKTLLALAISLKDVYSVSEEAWRALADAGPRAVPTLIGVLRSENSAYDERIAATRALGRIGPKAASAIPALVSFLIRDLDKPLTHRAVSGALKSMGKEAEETAPLLALVSSEDKDESEAVKKAVQALKAMEPDTRKKALDYLASTEKPPVSERAAKVFLEVGEPAAAVLAQALSKTDEDGRVRIAKILAEMGPRARDALPVIVEGLLEGEEKGVLFDAYEKVLLKIGAPSVAPFVALLENKKLPAKSRRRAIRVLGDLAAESEPEVAQSAVSPMIDVLGDSESEVSGTVRSTLVSLNALPMDLLLQALGNPSKGELVRREAALILGNISSTGKVDLRVVHALIQALEEEGLRVAAERGLAQIKGPAVRLLVDALNDTNRRTAVRVGAINALMVIGPSAAATSPDVVPSLLTLVKEDSEGDVRTAAALASAAIAPDDAEVFSVLIDRLKKKEEGVLAEPDARVLKGVVTALGILARGNPALARVSAPAVIGRLKDDDPGVREQAASVLADLDFTEVPPAVLRDAISSALKTLEDQSDSVRDSALRTLARIGAPALPDLIQVSENKNLMPTTQRAAVTVLGEIGEKGKLSTPAVVSVVEALIKSLKDNETKPAALQALVKTHSSSVEALAKILKDSSITTEDRKLAIETLAYLAHFRVARSKEIGNILEGVEKSPEEAAEIQDAARKALQEMRWGTGSRGEARRPREGEAWQKLPLQEGDLENLSPELKAAIQYLYNEWPGFFMEGKLRAKAPFGEVEYYRQRGDFGQAAFWVIAVIAYLIKSHYLREDPIEVTAKRIEGEFKEASLDYVKQKQKRGTKQKDAPILGTGIPEDQFVDHMIELQKPESSKALVAFMYRKYEEAKPRAEAREFKETEVLKEAVTHLEEGKTDQTELEALARDHVLEWRNLTESLKVSHPPYSSAYGKIIREGLRAKTIEIMEEVLGKVKPFRVKVKEDPSKELAQVFDLKGKELAAVEWRKEEGRLTIYREGEIVARGRETVELIGGLEKMGFAAQVEEKGYVAFTLRGSQLPGQFAAGYQVLWNDPTAWAEALGFAFSAQRAEVREAGEGIDYADWQQGGKKLRAIDRIALEHELNVGKLITALGPEGVVSIQDAYFGSDETERILSQQMQKAEGTRDLRPRSVVQLLLWASHANSPLGLATSVGVGGPAGAAKTAVVESMNRYHRTAPEFLHAVVKDDLDRTLLPSALLNEDLSVTELLRGDIFLRDRTPPQAIVEMRKLWQASRSAEERGDKHAARRFFLQFLEMNNALRANHYRPVEWGTPVQTSEEMDKKFEAERLEQTVSKAKGLLNELSFADFIPRRDNKQIARYFIRLGDTGNPQIVLRSSKELFVEINGEGKEEFWERSEEGLRALSEEEFARRTQYREMFGLEAIPMREGRTAREYWLFFTEPKERLTRKEKINRESAIRLVLDKWGLLHVTFGTVVSQPGKREKRVFRGATGEATLRPAEKSGTEGTSVIEVLFSLRLGPAALLAVDWIGIVRDWRKPLFNLYFYVVTHPLIRFVRLFNRAKTEERDLDEEAYELLRWGRQWSEDWVIVRNAIRAAREGKAPIVPISQLSRAELIWWIDHYKEWGRKGDLVKARLRIRPGDIPEHLRKEVGLDPNVTEIDPVEFFQKLLSRVREKTVLEEIEANGKTLTHFTTREGIVEARIGRYRIMFSLPARVTTEAPPLVADQTYRLHENLEKLFQEILPNAGGYFRNSTLLDLEGLEVNFKLLEDSEPVPIRLGKVLVQSNPPLYGTVRERLMDLVKKEAQAEKAGEVQDAARYHEEGVEILRAVLQGDMEAAKGGIVNKYPELSLDQKVPDFWREGEQVAFLTALGSVATGPDAHMFFDPEKYRTELKKEVPESLQKDYERLVEETLPKTRDNFKHEIFGKGDPKAQPLPEVTNVPIVRNQLGVLSPIILEVKIRELKDRFDERVVETGIEIEEEGKTVRVQLAPEEKILAWTRLYWQEISYPGTPGREILQEQIEPALTQRGDQPLNQDYIETVLRLTGSKDPVVKRWAETTIEFFLREKPAQPKSEARMLVLERKIGEEVVIGDKSQIVIRLTEMKDDGTIRLAVKAHRDIPIRRKELPRGPEKVDLSRYEAPPATQGWLLLGRNLEGPNREIDDRQSVLINEEIEVIVLSVRGTTVKFGFRAPREIPIWRSEIFPPRRPEARLSDGGQAREGGFEGLKKLANLVEGWLKAAETAEEAAHILNQVRGQNGFPKDLFFEKESEKATRVGVSNPKAKLDPISDDYRKPQEVARAVLSRTADWKATRQFGVSELPLDQLIGLRIEGMPDGAGVIRALEAVRELGLLPKDVNFRAREMALDKGKKIDFVVVEGKGKTSGAAVTHTDSSNLAKLILRETEDKTFLQRHGVLNLPLVELIHVRIFALDNVEHTLQALEGLKALGRLPKNVTLERHRTDQDIIVVKNTPAKLGRKGIDVYYKSHMGFASAIKEAAEIRPEARRQRLLRHVARRTVNYFRRRESGNEVAIPGEELRVSGGVTRFTRRVGAEEVARAVTLAEKALQERLQELNGGWQEERVGDFLWWVRDIVSHQLEKRTKNGLLGIGFDGSGEEKPGLEAALDKLGAEEKGKLVAFISRNLGAVETGGFKATIPNTDFDNFRPLYQIRHNQIENANRIPRIVGSDGAGVSEGDLNRYVFTVASKGSIAGLDSGLEEMLRYLSEIAVGSVTSAEIEDVQELRAKPREIREQVLTALFLLERYPDLRSRMPFKIEGSRLTINLPLLAELIHTLRAREMARQSA